ncbi:gamma-glutamyltransferase family protein [Kushneria phosphatilytica]|uniref:Gamma-glutamyltransferase family protein n=1 Tax=Kushneria phosphatilytica TaxID=657387 RepID=A0A1S1NR95_9GAMM|nr:gamma-glutamyltransferase family protein [Kushneria phosphatilytica]OHV07622.1 gamma-glutamyltransferase [Kushneria phosphatilytica]QEL10109.1 gamma-glutamyltransferase family protein [Kushneria phosphatilytica]
MAISSPFTTRPEIKGTFGAISSTHWLASSVGMAMLEKGGNAFDAAVAAGFVLQIVEPHLNGPGGEVPIIVKRPGDESPTVICGQGVTPAAATPERFAALGLGTVPGTGLLPAVVPGAFDAWMLLLRDYGSLPLATVLAPAIGYARDGFPLLARAVSSIIPVVDYFQREWPSSAEQWLVDGRAPRPDALFRSPTIAATYQRIVDEASAAGGSREARIERARACFYEGFVAEAIDDFYRREALMDSTGERHQGLLSGDDMAQWRASYEPTLSYDYAGYTVHKTGPWGQGPVFLQQLALLKDIDFDAMTGDSAEFVHTVTEAAKLAFADREAWYGDPLFSDVPIQQLLSEPYNRKRRQLLSESASVAMRPGLPGGETNLKAMLALAGSEPTIGPGGGEPTFAPLPEVEGDTVHLDVADRFGNMVSATPSGGWLQSSPAVPGLGFSISTRAQMTWLTPGLPSSLRPRMRPRTTLTPTLVTRDGEGYMALGSPGGDQQDQWSLIVFLRHVHYHMGLQAAIDAPLFQMRHFPASFHPREHVLNRLIIEGRFPPSTLCSLRERGHEIRIQDDWALGRVCAVSRRDGMIHAGATPRHMQGYAIGR